MQEEQKNLKEHLLSPLMTYDVFNSYTLVNVICRVQGYGGVTGFIFLALV